MQKAFKRRRSSYCFNPIKLSHAVLDDAFEAARWAPSPFNFQPWRFLCFDRDEERFRGLIETCAPRNQMWAKNASFLLACCAEVPNRRGTYKTSQSIYAQYDDMTEYSVGICVGLFLAELTKSPLQAHQMRGFDESSARQVLELPDTVRLLTLIAIGQELEEGAETFTDFDEVLRNRMKVKRVRKKMDEIVVWNQSGIMMSR
jgi:nitroreductase